MSKCKYTYVEEVWRYRGGEMNIETLSLTNCILYYKNGNINDTVVDVEIIPKDNSTVYKSSLTYIKDIICETNKDKFVYFDALYPYGDNKLYIFDTKDDLHEHLKTFLGSNDFVSDYLNLIGLNDPIVV